MRENNCLKLLNNVIEAPDCGGFGRIDRLGACSQSWQDLQSQGLEEAEPQSPIIVGEKIYLTLRRTRRVLNQEKPVIVGEEKKKTDYEI